MIRFSTLILVVVSLILTVKTQCIEPTISTPDGTVFFDGIIVIDGTNPSYSDPNCSGDWIAADADDGKYSRGGLLRNPGYNYHLNYGYAIPYNTKPYEVSVSSYDYYTPKYKSTVTHYAYLYVALPCMPILITNLPDATHSTQNIPLSFAYNSTLNSTKYTQCSQFSLQIYLAGNLVSSTTYNTGLLPFTENVDLYTDETGGAYALNTFTKLNENVLDAYATIQSYALPISIVNCNIQISPDGFAVSNQNELIVQSLTPIITGTADPACMSTLQSTLSIINSDQNLNNVFIGQASGQWSVQLDLTGQADGEFLFNVFETATGIPADNAFIQFSLDTTACQDIPTISKLSENGVSDSLFHFASLSPNPLCNEIYYGISNDNVNTIADGLASTLAGAGTFSIDFSSLSSGQYSAYLTSLGGTKYPSDALQVPILVQNPCALPGFTTNSLTNGYSGTNNVEFSIFSLGYGDGYKGPGCPILSYQLVQLSNPGVPIQPLTQINNVNGIYNLPFTGLLDGAYELTAYLQADGYDTVGMDSVSKIIKFTIAATMCPIANVQITSTTVTSPVIITFMGTYSGLSECSQISISIFDGSGNLIETLPGIPQLKKRKRSSIHKRDGTPFTASTSRTYPPGTYSYTASNGGDTPTSQSDPQTFQVQGASQPTGGTQRRRKRSICSFNETLCTFRSGRKLVEECVYDLSTNLEQCGSCGGPDCTVIDNVDDIICFNGECQIQACSLGYELLENMCIPI